MARVREKTIANRQRYQLREGYALREGDTMVYGPDFITRSLDEAFKIKHMLEEQSDVEAAMAERVKKQHSHTRDKKLRAAAERRGFDPDEVMGTKPADNKGDEDESG